MYFRPKIGVSADVIPYYENGTYYLYYLNDYRDWNKYGEGCPWCLLETKDFVNFVDHGVVIERGTALEQDLYVFTGCVFKHSGEYYVFYTGHNPHLRAKGLPEQKVLLAKGKSLTKLEKQKDFCFSAPDYIEPHDFRDPFVYYDEAEGNFKMLLAARVKEGPFSKRGVTMIAHSDDLLNWTLEEKPFYSPMSYFTHECPDFFKMGEYYYLLFSEFSDKVVTRYRYSKNPRGPWLVPKNDTFDGHAFYAAKSAADENGNRYLFGWNCIKYKEVDFERWQWGGTIIPHKLTAHENGELTVSIPPSIYQSYDTLKSASLVDAKNVDIVRKRYITSNIDYSYVLFKKRGDNYLIEAQFKLKENWRDFGFILNSDKEFNRYYMVKFDPLHQRFAFDRIERNYSDVHIMVDTERPLKLVHNKAYSVIIVVEGSVIEVYVNNEVAMSARMFDIKGDCFGIYSNGSKVEFTKVKLKTGGKK